MNFIEECFEINGLPYGAAAFEKVKISDAGQKIGAEYKTVLMTYVPYFYNAKKEQNVCLYAALPDYHAYVARKLLPVSQTLRERFPDNVFDIFVDSSPIDEKKAAILAGFGFRGKNSLLITEKSGSFVLLGSILTDLETDTSDYLPTDRCKDCARCIRACPSGAITEKAFDRTRCVSYLTQKKGVLSDGEAELIRKNGLVWGCDRCQRACPFNNNLPLSEFGKSKKCPPLEYDTVKPLSDREFRERYSDYAFTWRGLKVILRNLEILRSDY